MWTAEFAPRAALAVPAAHADVLQRRVPDRLRPGQLVGRAVLLPGGPADLPGHRLPEPAADPVRRAGPLRAGVHPGPRVRPPPADPARHRAAGAPAQQQRPPPAPTPLSVELELQADCFAGVWGRAGATPRRQRDRRRQAEVAQAQNAAAAVGDDRIQQAGGGGSTRSPGRTAPPPTGSRWYTTGFTRRPRTPATPSADRAPAAPTSSPNRCRVVPLSGPGRVQGR